MTVAPGSWLRLTPALAGVLLCLALLAGCAAPVQTRGLQEQWPVSLPETVLLSHVPFVAQDDHLCGPASLSMMAQAAGRQVTMQELTPQVYLPGRQGALQVEMQAVARRHGLVAYPLAPRLDALLEQLANGRPVLVLQNLALSSSPLWHYAVVIGYDRSAGEVTLHSGTTERLTMRLSVFERTWARADHWALLVLGPSDLPASADVRTWTTAVAALERADVASARKGWQAALQRWPGERVALFGLGTTAYALGDRDGARSAFEETVRSHPDFADAWHNLALVLHEQGRGAQAGEAIKRAIGLGGQRVDEYRLLQQKILAKAPAAADKSPRPAKRRPQAPLKSP